MQTTLPNLCKNSEVDLPQDISLSGPFSSLGVVSEAKDSYFNSTQTSRKCAEVFFSQAVKDTHHLDLLRKNSVTEGEGKTSPPCLAFMTAAIKSKILDEPPKQLCFVSLSGWEDNDERKIIKKRFQSSIKKARDNKINDHKFEFIEVSTQRFSAVSYELNKELHNDAQLSVKPCAEKRLVNAAMNFMSEHGSDFQVTGFSTYGLHPFAEENKDDLTNKVKYPANAINSLKGTLDKGTPYFIAQIPACSKCQENKLAALLMMKHAQDEKSQGGNLTELLKVPPLLPKIRISQATCDFISPNPVESLKSIRMTNTDMTLSSGSSAGPSSIDSRSRASSLQSEASSIMFTVDAGDKIELEKKQLLELELDIENSKKKLEKLEKLNLDVNSNNASFFKNPVDDATNIEKQKKTKNKALKA